MHIWGWDGDNRANFIIFKESNFLFWIHEIIPFLPVLSKLIALKLNALTLGRRVLKVQAGSDFNLFQFFLQEHLFAILCLFIFARSYSMLEAEVQYARNGRATSGRCIEGSGFKGAG